MEVARATTHKELEDAFRESLRDSAVIIDTLAEHCSGFADMIGMIQLGAQNDGQLRMIMSIVNEKLKNSDESHPNRRR